MYPVPGSPPGVAVSVIPSAQQRCLLRSRNLLSPHHLTHTRGRSTQMVKMRGLEPCVLFRRWKRVTGAVCLAAVAPETPEPSRPMRCPEHLERPKSQINLSRG